MGHRYFGSGARFFLLFFYQLTILIPSYMVFGTSSVRLDIIHRHLSYLIEELILSGFRGQEICIYICLHLVVLLSCVKEIGGETVFFLLFLLGGCFLIRGVDYVTYVRMTVLCSESNLICISKAGKILSSLCSSG